jgi:hypothetical protein
MKQVSELTSGSRSGVESAEVLIQDYPSRDQLQNGRRNFKEEWCKELPWLKFNHTTGTAIYEQCSYLPTYCRSKFKYSERFLQGLSNWRCIKSMKNHSTSKVCNVILSPVGTIRHPLGCIHEKGG